MRGMSESIIVAFITGAISLFGTVLTIIATSRKQAAEMKITQAVMNKEIEELQNRFAELKEEVREHNNYAKRLPVVEKQIEVINHRLDDLEG